MLTLLCTPQPVNNADFIIPVEIDGIMHQVMGEAGCPVGGGHSPCCPFPDDWEPSQLPAPRAVGASGCRGGEVRGNPGVVPCVSG